MGLAEAPLIYFSTTDDGRLLEVNSYLSARLGYEQEELTGKHSEVLYTISTRIFQQTHFFPLLKMKGHAEEIFITMKTKDGTQIPVLINAERKDEGTPVIHYAGIIVPNRKKFEDELIAAKRAAESALNENSNLVRARKELQEHSEMLDRQMDLVNKQNEELRQINRVVTHDMQEPVRKITIFSDMLTKDPGDTVLADKILRVVRQMKNVLSGLQEYVWLSETPLKPVTINLEKIIEEICQNLSLDYPGIELCLTIEEIPSFDADREQMKLLFYEVLQNSFRFRKEKGLSIHITATEIQQNVFRNSTHKYQYETFVSIRVHDNGSGFDPAYKNHVFELFKRLHQETGQGVGLALCRKIAKNHNGLISIESEPGNGTTVILKLPVTVSE